MVSIFCVFKRNSFFLSNHVDFVVANNIHADGFERFIGDVGQLDGIAFIETRIVNAQLPDCAEFLIVCLCAHNVFNQ